MGRIFLRGFQLRLKGRLRFRGLRSRYVFFPVFLGRRSCIVRGVLGCVKSCFVPDLVLRIVRLRSWVFLRVFPVWQVLWDLRG